MLRRPFLSFTLALLFGLGQQSAAVRNWPAHRQLAGGYAIGIAAYAAGLALSATLDLPSGAIIVWALALVGLLANLAAKRL